MINLPLTLKRVNHPIHFNPWGSVRVPEITDPPPKLYDFMEMMAVSYDVSPLRCPI